MADDSAAVEKVEARPGLEKRPVGRPRRTLHQKDAFRRLIIEAARELFVEQGFEAVSMRKVAARAGCAPMTIYQVFENKRALLRHIWGDIFEEVLRRCTRAVSRAKGAPAGLRAFAHCFIGYWLEQPDHYRVIYLNEDAVAEETDSSFVESSGIVERFSLVQELVRQAMAEGHIEAGDPELATQALLCVLHGIAHSLITIPEYPWRDRSQVINATLDAFFSGLGMGQD